jgi:hypothetical protein
MKRVATNPRNAHRVASDLRIASCSNPQSVSGKYFINMKNPEDIVLLVNPNNNIFYCYTEAEFQRILKEEPPFVIQAHRAPASIERQQDPERTFWVYKTQFGYIDKSLYDLYMAGSKTFKMIPSNKEQMLFKTPGGIGAVHDYPAVVYKVIPIDRDALLSGKGEIVKDETIVVFEGKHQEIKEREDILPDEEDELLDENEIKEYLEKSESERREMLSVKRDEKKKEEEELKKILEKKGRDMVVRIEKQKKQGGFQDKLQYELDELLIDGCQDCDFEQVKNAIQNGADIHGQNDYALGIASTEGCIEIVKYLIDKGADIHAENDFALRFACFQGRFEIVKYLIDKGADIHAENDYALRRASKKGHFQVVKLLVENGANVHAQNDQALCQAAGNGHLEVVKLLVEHGADVHAWDDFPLGWAKQKGHFDVVNYLKSVMKQ